MSIAHSVRASDRDELLLNGKSGIELGRGESQLGRIIHGTKADAPAKFRRRAAEANQQRKRKKENLLHKNTRNLSAATHPHKSKPSTWPSVEIIP